MIWWGGVCSEDVGVVVERFPSQNGPARRLETIQIPGRNGDLIIDSGAYDNYTQEYEVYFHAGVDQTPQAARDVRAWLASSVSYQRLEDSYDPDCFRMAYYAGPAEIENIMNEFGRMVISFICKPQRFLRIGEQVLSCTAGGSLFNPGLPSLPLIKVSGSGAGYLYIGAYTVQILSLDGYVMLDSDTQNAYKDTLNKNSTISAPEFPVLQPGENTISWDGGITSVEITPRWWTV